jgi:Restriction endonuclease
MGRPKVYIQDIRRKRTHAQLFALWKRIRNGEPLRDWPAGKAFEHLILRAFELEEATVRWPYEVNMASAPGSAVTEVGRPTSVLEQIDGIVYFDHLSVVIEAKDHKDDINFEPITKLRSQLLRRPGHAIGSVFSRRGFTGPATVLAQFLAPQTVLLWRGEDIDIALRKKKMREGLMAKLRHAVEYALPDYPLSREKW